MLRGGDTSQSPSPYALCRRLATDCWIAHLLAFLCESHGQGKLCETFSVMLHVPQWEWALGGRSGKHRGWMDRVMCVCVCVWSSLLTLRSRFLVITLPQSYRYVRESTSIYKVSSVPSLDWLPGYPSKYGVTQLPGEVSDRSFRDAGRKHSSCKSQTFELRCWIYNQVVLGRTKAIFFLFLSLSLSLEWLFGSVLAEGRVGRFGMKETITFSSAPLVRWIGLLQANGTKTCRSTYSGAGAGKFTDYVRWVQIFIYWGLTFEGVEAVRKIIRTVRAIQKNRDQLNHNQYSTLKTNQYKNKRHSFCNESRKIRRSEVFGLRFNFNPLYEVKSTSTLGHQFHANKL